MVIASELGFVAVARMGQCCDGPAFSCSDAACGFGCNSLHSMFIVHGVCSLVPMVVSKDIPDSLGRLPC